MLRSILAVIHPDALKLLWLIVQIVGVYSIGRNLHIAMLNKAYLAGSGQNGELRIEADGSIREEWLRLSAVVVGLTLGVIVLFIYGAPQRSTLASEVFAYIFGLCLTYISGVAVLNSFMQRSKVAKMLAYRGIDLKGQPLDLHRE